MVEELLVQQVSFINISSEFNIITVECLNTSALLGLRFYHFPKCFGVHMMKAVEEYFLGISNRRYQNIPDLLLN